MECGLKSCIIKHLLATDQFPEKRFSEQCWTHNLSQLVVLAGLKTALDTDLAADPELAAKWGFVRDWNETSRYARKNKTEALKLYKSIRDARHGVLPWIISRW